MMTVALAGGVGGAKLAHGLSQVLPPESLTVVVNTGDDFEHLGLTICPDLDTVTYTLAGLANPEAGWGRSSETWTVLDELRRLGGPDWFRLGDRDLALHLERTRRLRAGQSLTAVTEAVTRGLGVAVRVLPMSDDPVRTMVFTDEGELAFQDYFVRRRCEPMVRALRFDGAERAAPTAAVRAALAAAERVILCPSNPFLSIDPILALPGMRSALQDKLVIAVTPIVGGQAIKGPAAKLLRELGRDVSAEAVADYYAGLADVFVLDQIDAALAPAIERLGLRVLVTDTLMPTSEARARLARELIATPGG
jgi:LPPG:FO 2-phospho-L-lactate transferase